MENKAISKVMTLEEVKERVFAIEGAIQWLMSIIVTALPHTDPQLSDLNAEWERIIRDIKRNCSKEQP